MSRKLCTDTATTFIQNHRYRFALLQTQLPVQRSFQSQCRVDKVLSKYSQRQLGQQQQQLVSLRLPSCFCADYRISFSCIFQIFFLMFNDLYFFQLLSCEVFMHRPATRIPPMLVQYDDDANSSVCLPERLMVGQCINLQSAFLP